MLSLSATHNSANAPQLISHKEPVNPVSTISIVDSSTSESNTKIIQSERLNTGERVYFKIPITIFLPRVNFNPSYFFAAESPAGKNSTAVAEPTRKRSRDSETKDSSKRRKVSTDANDMGGIVTKIKGIVATAATTCSSQSETSSSSSSSGKRKDKDKDDEIDRLVEEIEKTGKSSSSHDSHHKNKKSHHKHSRHKHSRKDHDSKDIKDSNSNSSSSSSHRKENRSKDDHQQKKNNNIDDKRDRGKDRKDSRRDHQSTKHSDHHKRRKESNDSVSSSHSPKDRKRIRTSSSCNDVEDGKRHERHHSSSEHSSSSSSRKKGHSSSSSPKKEDGKSSKLSDRSAELMKETLKSVQQNNSIDTTNRFNALAESSADESAYNSDVFDDSIDFKYPGGSDSEDDPEAVARECLELFENYKPEEPQKPKNDKKVDISKEELDEGFCVVGKKRVAHANAIMKAPSTSSILEPPRVKQPPATSKNLQDQLLKRFEEQSKSRINVQNG